jgi:hypothetical protein
MRTKRTKTVEVVPEAGGGYAFTARLTDRAWDGQFGGPGEVVIHDIEITGRLSGPDLTVTQLDVTPLELPYGPCPTVAPAAAALVGSGLRRGWRQAVLGHLGGAKGCTHMTTLLLGLAEVTTQVIFQEMNARTPYTPVTRRDGSWQGTGLDIAPDLVDVCYSLRQDSPVMIPLLRDRPGVPQS